MVLLLLLIKGVETGGLRYGFMTRNHICGSQFPRDLRLVYLNSYSGAAEPLSHTTSPHYEVTSLIGWPVSGADQGFSTERSQSACVGQSTSGTFRAPSKNLRWICAHQIISVKIRV